MSSFRLGALCFLVVQMGEKCTEDIPGLVYFVITPTHVPLARGQDHTAHLAAGGLGDVIFLRVPEEKGNAKSVLPLVYPSGHQISILLSSHSWSKLTSPQGGQCKVPSSHHLLMDVQNIWAMSHLLHQSCNTCRHCSLYIKETSYLHPASPPSQPICNGGTRMGK